jgi:hypothetical protein
MPDLPKDVREYLGYDYRRRRREKSNVYLEALSALYVAVQMLIKSVSLSLFDGGDHLP